MNLQQSICIIQQEHNWDKSLTRKAGSYATHRW